MGDSSNPNDYIYQYFSRISGPQSASGEDKDLNTNSESEDSIFAYSNSEKVSLIARVNIAIMGGTIRNDRFGNLSESLTSGCLFRVVDDNGGMMLDFLGGSPIMQGADFAALAGVDSILSAAAGDDLLPIRFSVFKASKDKALRLKRGFRIEWVNRDDLSSLSLFKIMIQGEFETSGPQGRRL